MAHPIRQVYELFDTEKLTYQLAEDLEGKPKGLSGRVAHYSPERIGSLEKFNLMGYAIWFCPQETDFKGRTEKNIKRVRALVVDLDEDGEKKLETVLALKTEPHLIVESSKNKFHVYWLVNNCPLNKFSDLQKALANRFGGDMKCHDLPRVFRAPGFFHEKKRGIRFESRIIGEVGVHQPYDVAGFIDLMELRKWKVRESEGEGSNFDRRKVLVQGVKKGDRHNQIYKLACSLRSRDLDAVEAEVLLFEANSRFLPPLTDREVLSALRSAWKHPAGRSEDVTQEPSEEAQRDKLDPDVKKEGKKRRGRPADTKTPRGGYEDHIALVSKHLGEIKRDIFSDDLLYRCEWDGVWRPVDNYLGIIKAQARIQRDLGVMKYELDAFVDYLQQWRSELKQELIVEIPEWDGKDRVGFLCSMVKLEGGLAVIEKDFEPLVKEWLGKVFQRLADPHIQNTILVLKGGQGIGKDTWVESLVGGLGQFATPVTIMSDKKDTLLQLNEALVLRIAEFDRAARMEVSTIKDMVTAPHTNVRQPYGKRKEFRPCRCSFVATANVDDILRDYTGNRRYTVFELESISWEYPSSHDEKLQVLAQGQALAAEKFTAGEESAARMDEYIREKTPDAPAVMIEETWSAALAEHLEGLPQLERTEIEMRGWITNQEASGVFSQVARMVGMKPSRVRNELKNSGLSTHGRVGGKPQRGYTIKDVAVLKILNSNRLELTTSFSRYKNRRCYTCYSTVTALL